ncbi:hypothetical protein ACFWWB_17330 [Streptomyces sp. NPDC058690]|uniref:hypothetical protein n=1 Tax=Streptomyces sp. NPDC058690 TaxID=3346600 RepID=UPI0036665AF9
MQGDGSGVADREVTQDFMLRMYVIHHLEPDHKDPNWSSEGLAADTLGALSLMPSDVGASATKWRELPIEQVRQWPRR